eukprot:1221212-Amorphochlora_amoeboformis.AAC.1
MTVSHSYRALSEGGDGDGVEGYGHVLRDRGKVGELGWRERLCRFFTPMRTIWMFVGVNILNYLDRGIIPGAVLFEILSLSPHGGGGMSAEPVSIVHTKHDHDR